MNKWSDFCIAINSRKYEREADLESFFKQCLIEIFGWNEQEIEQQKSVYYGHEKIKRTDLTLRFEDHTSLIIELKAPGIKLTARDSIEQVSSYMNQTLAKFGFLANDKNLLLFYKTTNDYEQPKCILDLELDEENEDGKRLGELLGRNNYNEAEFKKFCEEKLYAQRVKDLRGLLTSGSGRDVLLRALANSDDDKEAWRSALNKVSFLPITDNDRPAESNDGDSEELKVLLSKNGKQVIFEALSKSRADGEYYTDDMRKTALSELKIVRWATATLAYEKSRRTYTGRSAELDFNAEVLAGVDEKIKGLVVLYNKFAINDEDSNVFLDKCTRDIEWATKNILCPEVLEEISADRMREWLEKEAKPNLALWRDGQVFRGAYELFKPKSNKIGVNDMEANKRKLIDNINFVRNTSEENRFEALGELLDNGSSRNMWGWGPEAWSPLMSYCFPNQIPRINEATRSFFDCIGLHLYAKNRKPTAKHFEFIYNCFCRWSRMAGGNPLTLFQCDNLIAFAMRKARGQQYLNEHFGADLEVETKIDRKV